MSEAATTKKAPQTPPIFDFTSHKFSHDTLQMKWTETPLFVNARLATNNDKRLTSNYFIERAKTWPPGSRDAFLINVATATKKQLDWLFSDDIYLAIPKTATWEKDTVSLWLVAISEGDFTKPETSQIMVSDQFLTRMNSWPNELRKVLFGTMKTTHEHKLLTDDILLDRVELLSKEDLGDACGYLWHMGATKSMITIDEFRKIQKAKFL